MDIFHNQTVLDFGKVCVNVKHVKTFTVVNNDTVDQVFTVAKWSSKPKLCSGFSIKPHVTPAVKCGESFQFEVELCSSAAGQNCSTTFIVNHLYGVKSVIFAKAHVQSVDCSLKLSELVMKCSSDKRKCEKKFVITNNGTCPAHFQLTTQTIHPSLSVTPSQGTVTPSQEVCLTATFTPVDHRPRVHTIFCLLSSQEPFIIEVHTVWLRPDRNNSLVIAREGLPVYPNRYQCYLQDVTGTDTNRPVVLHKYNMDFSHCQPKRVMRTEFLVKNEYGSRLTIEWSKGTSEVFKIQPEREQIEVNSSTVFTASFCPPVRDMLYGAYIDAQLYTDSQLLPFPVNINLKGHSFFNLSCGWLPVYKVKPSVLSLPPCLVHPFHPTHSTLVIHRLGHLPLSFTINPPENTNFTVKPEQGVVQGRLQIVVVQFRPKSLYEALYSEKWMISFNSNENVNQCIIQLEGSVEVPEVIINNCAEVVFSPIHPGTSQERLVDFYNPTRLCFSYKLRVVKGESTLDVGESGVIWPEEHKQVTWRFTPQGVGEMEAVVVCTPGLEGEMDATVRETTVVVRGSCQATQLQVHPHRLIFLKVLRNFTHERRFHLTNIGDALIEADLLLLPEDHSNVSELEVLFSPKTFKLEPRDSVFIEVTIRPLMTCKATYNIGFSGGGLTPTPLLPLIVEAVFPSLQVTDIRLNNTGPLFSKLDFWKVLQLTRLNEVLGNIVPGKNSNVLMALPSYQSKTPPMTVELLLENTSDVTVTLALTMRQTCCCVPVLVPISFSRSQRKDRCPHKNQLRITPTTAKIESHGHAVLSLEVWYNTVGCVMTMFDLSVTPDDYDDEVLSSVELHIQRYSIPELSPHVDTVETCEGQDFVFNMRPVYLGDRYPAIQAYTLYNNTTYSISCELDDSSLQGTPFKYILKQTEISPMTNHPLLFTFLPYSTKMAEATVRLVINNNVRKLTLRGRGTLTAEREDDNDDIPVTKGGKLVHLKPAPIFLSASHINIVRIRPSSTNRQIVFINNKTAEIINYKWHQTKVADVMELRVHPPRGVIHPGEVEECRIVGYCKGWPCYLTATLTCVYASFNRYASAIEAARRYKEMVAATIDNFTLTEHGTFDKEIPPPKEEWPEKQYFTVSVTMEACYDLCLDDKHVMPHTLCSVQPPRDQDNTTQVSEEEAYYIRYVLERVIWDVLNEVNTGKRGNPEPKSVVRYAQMKQVEEASEVPVPRETLKTVLEDVLYTGWQEVFQLPPRSSMEMKTLLTQLHAQAQKLQEEETCTKPQELPQPLSQGEV